MTDNNFKIVILGSGGVGKSALTIRLITDNFLEEYDPTIEDSYQKTLVVDGESTQINILDTAGQEEYSSMQDQWMREGKAFMLVYSIVEKQTYEDLNKIRDKILAIRKNSSYPIILLGNKSDLEEHRQVPQESGQKLAEKWKCSFFETSAKEKINSLECFHEAVRLIKSSSRKENLNKENNRVNNRKKFFCNII